MLRAFQTTALSNKLSKAFDALAKTVAPQRQPALVGADRWDYQATAYESTARPSSRRRRYRRNRVAAASGSIRTSWF